MIFAISTIGLKDSQSDLRAVECRTALRDFAEYNGTLGVDTTPQVLQVEHDTGDEPGAKFFLDEMLYCTYREGVSSADWRFIGSHETQVVFNGTTNEHLPSRAYVDTQGNLFFGEYTGTPAAGDRVVMQGINKLTGGITFTVTNDDYLADVPDGSSHNAINLDVLHTTEKAVGAVAIVRLSNSVTWFTEFTPSGAMQHTLMYGSPAGLPPKTDVYYQTFQAWGLQDNGTEFRYVAYDGNADETRVISVDGTNYTEHGSADGKPGFMQGTTFIQQRDKLAADENGRFICVELNQDPRLLSNNATDVSPAWLSTLTAAFPHLWSYALRGDVMLIITSEINSSGRAESAFYKISDGTLLYPRFWDILTTEPRTEVRYPYRFTTWYGINALPAVDIELIFAEAAIRVKDPEGREEGAPVWIKHVHPDDAICVIPPHNLVKHPNE